jgi:hypothetical protein
MRRTTLVALLLLTVAGPLAAYTIYLSDGSTLQVRDPLRIEGQHAYFTLMNGTESFLPLVEIDLDRTREANEGAYGGTIQLRDDAVKVIDTPPENTEPETLGDLIASGTAGTRMRPTAKRPPAPATRPEPATRRAPTESQRARREHGDLVLVGEIQQAFQAQGLDQVEVFKSASSSRPLIEIRTNSEAAVFRALETAAPLLLQLQDSFPGQTRELELVLLTDRDENAGRFILDPGSATALTEKEINVSSFYVRNVLF